LLEAAADDGLAASLHDTGSDKQALSPELGVAHAFGIGFEVSSFGANHIDHFRESGAERTHGRNIGARKRPTRGYSMAGSVVSFRYSGSLPEGWACIHEVATGSSRFPWPGSWPRPFPRWRRPRSGRRYLAPRLSRRPSLPFWKTRVPSATAASWPRAALTPRRSCRRRRWPINGKAGRRFCRSSVPGKCRPKASLGRRRRSTLWSNTSRVNSTRRTATPNPGRVTAHRRNRTEYANTIRDLLDVEFRAQKDFPTDDSGEGFDNIGDILTISPVLMEKYMAAAERIASRAIAADPLPKPIAVEYSNKDKRVRRVDASTIEATHRIDFDGEYTIRVALPGERPAAAAKPVMLGFWMDGKPIGSKMVETKPSGLVFFDPYSEEEMRLLLPEGDHVFRAGFIDDDFVKGLGPRDLYNKKGNKFADGIVFEGPFKPKDEPASRARILICDPNSGQACVEKIIGNLARHTYRRPVSKVEVASLEKFVGIAQAHGQSVEQGIQLALQAILVSPNFLFRIEHDPNPDRPYRGPQNLRRGTGLAAELFPVEFDAGRRTAGLGRSRQTPRPRRAGCAGEAHAGRSAIVGAGRQLRRPVARNPQSGRGETRSAEVPRLGSRIARRDAQRDQPVLRLHPAPEPADGGFSGRAVHVSQRTAGQALGHRGREGPRVSKSGPPRRSARRGAEPGRRAHGFELRPAHLGGDSREVHSAGDSGDAAGSAAGDAATA